MKRRNNFSKSLIKLVLGGSLVLSGFVLTDYSPSSNLTIEEKERIRKTVSSVAKEQEQIFKIDHIGEPKISFVPELSSVFNGYLGIYKSWSDEMWIRPGDNERGSVAHELGHRYKSQVDKEIGKEWYKSFWGSVFVSKKDKLISEGIATYFKYRTIRRTLGKRMSHGDFKRYLRENKKNGALYQEVGFLVVEPVLDRDVRMGVEILRRNPPSKRDLRDLIGYRERILEMMAEN